MDIPGFNLNSPEDSQAALELNERFISRYTELLDRFSVLPGCDAIIYEQLKGEFPADFLQSINNFTFLPPPGDPTLATANDMADGEAMPSPEELAQENEEANNIPDEELPPQLRLMRQTEQHILLVQNSVYQLLCDWCNLYGAVLPPERRTAGLQVLMVASLMLGNMRSCLDQMACFQFAMALQLSIRGEHYCKALFDLINELGSALPNLSALLSSRVSVLEQNLQVFKEIQRLLKQLPDTPQGDF
ncbi:MAG: hypothetical protein II943_06600 [Victivallales bacterium]|nr:hypothetical protein [Victivallales bacterium]